MSALPTRADYVAALRELADLFESTDVPLPTYQLTLSGALTVYANHACDEAASVARVAKAAQVLGVELASSDVGANVHHTADRHFGPILLHFSHVEDGAAKSVPGAVGEVAGPGAGSATAPAELEHYHVGGAAGPPGENDAECACGIVVAGCDTHAEAVAAIDQHIAAAETASRS